MRLFACLILALSLASCGATPLLADSPFTAFFDNEAIIAIYGEALHDYQSMYAIACALRNRHASLKGVYGRLQHPSEAMYQKAAKAWFESETGPDVVHGATNWLSDYDLKHCNPEKTAFRFWMKETAYIGKTHFYKEMPNNKDGTPYHV